MNHERPTDEEMRAEVPAIAKPYVMARDKTIAKLEFQLEGIRENVRAATAIAQQAGLSDLSSPMRIVEKLVEMSRAHATRANLAESALREAQERIARADAEIASGADRLDDALVADRRHGGWLLIIDTVDDPKVAVETFQRWRADGYEGDPRAYLPAIVPVDHAPAPTDLGRAHALPSACTCPNANCPCHPGDDVDPDVWKECDCAACKGKAEPGPEAVAVHPTLSSATAYGSLERCRSCGGGFMHRDGCPEDSPVADGPIATRFDAMDLCKCGHVRRVHGGGVCFACASTRMPTPVHEFAQSPAQLAHAFTAAREADVSDEPEVAGVSMNRAAEHLHAAQLGAREHVVPHLRAASEAAAAEGDHELAAACDFFAALVNGDLDPAILKYGAAFLRFVQGSGK